jgi:hypothetical protein
MMTTKTMTMGEGEVEGKADVEEDVWQSPLKVMAVISLHSLYILYHIFYHGALEYCNW